MEPYRRSLPTHTLDEQLPRAESMAAVLAHLDEEYGGTVGWLAETGWTEAQVEALRRFVALRDGRGRPPQGT